MKKIVLCVPNFSEGKDEKVINKIIEPLKKQEEFSLIKTESDPNYNRTVVSLLGDPEAMIEPLLNFFKQSLNLINLKTHQGEHPRMGAVDVVPFIPVKNITMDECNDYANKLAKKVNKHFNIPVFMYAFSAKTEQRESLPNIRQGEFENMALKLKDPNWHPDYGQNEIHPSFGVVAIGARMPLVAYNIDLDTKNQKIANSIARAIRKSSGGFYYVQAGAAYLENKAHMQVTMNILDYKKNPLYRVLEVVKMEAKRYQVKVISSEIVGLVSKDTLLRSINYYLLAANKSLTKNLSIEKISKLAISYLGLRDFNKEKIIEFYLGDK